MMLQVLHKILAFIIALAVLFSTMSFAVEKHVCMGEVTDVSYFNQAKGCEMNEEICEESFGAQTSVKKTKCCDTVHELIPGNQIEQHALSNLEIKNLNLLFTYIYNFVVKFEAVNFDTDNIKPSPPLVHTDIQVLYQTFLI